MLECKNVKIDGADKMAKLSKALEYMTVHNETVQLKKEYVATFEMFNMRK